jgi:allantoicase
MSAFLSLPDLAGERLGGAVLWANDEFFAQKENLLREAPAVWKEGEYTDRGKWMDGWETRRHRAPLHDWCIIRLGQPGIVRGVVIDTAFFRGNFPEAAALEGCVAPPDADAVHLDGTGEWFPLLDRSVLQGNFANVFPVDCPYAVTHLRFRIYPDGGVARLRVHGEPTPDLQRLKARGEIDLAGLTSGGQVLWVTDHFFSAPYHLLLPTVASGMHDGWETKRRRGPGHDAAEVRLGLAGEVTRVEVDTSYFRGNFPESAAIDIADVPAESLGEDGRPPESAWVEVHPPSALRAHTTHPYDLPAPVRATHVRLRIYPDGGVARLHVYGRPTVEGWATARLRWLNALAPAAAERALLGCCGSLRWAASVTSARPFADRSALEAAVVRAEALLTDEDWLEAFGAHPPIGGKKPDSPTRRWSEEEQSGVRSAEQATLDALAEGNAAYRERFGYTYIVCATGKSAGEMLAILQGRLANPPDVELRAAAAEQARITRIRLEKLLT